MEKLKLHTTDLVSENVQRLAELFPGCMTEARDSEGKITRSVDFDQLRQELSDRAVDGPRERYHLDWPGKREAMLAANAPIAKTLRPCRDESVSFESVIVPIGPVVCFLICAERSSEIGIGNSAASGVGMPEPVILCSGTG